MGSDLLIKESQVELADGKVYILSQFHLNAQIAVQDKYGISFEDANYIPKEEVETWNIPKMPISPNKDGKIPVSGFYLFLMRHLSKSSSATRFLIWQLLRANHRSLTEEEVGFLVVPDNKEKVFKEVLRLYIGSHPGSVDEKKILLALIEQMSVEKVA